jgi:hypothetical protein
VSANFNVEFNVSSTVATGDAAAAFDAVKGSTMQSLCSTGALDETFASGGGKSNFCSAKLSS